MGLPVKQIHKTNVPAIASALIALAANAGRFGWKLTNLGQNPLFYRLDNTLDCTTSVFHGVLAAGTANDNGTAGSYSEMSGAVWCGRVTVTGTAPRYCVTEYFDIQ